jgi:hypothetical protein
MATSENLADGLAKALERTRFERFIEGLGMVDIRTEVTLKKSIYVDNPPTALRGMAGLSSQTKYCNKITKGH